MIRVAIASENAAYDAELYRFLAALVLGEEIVRWDSASPVNFSGWKYVWRQAPLYLDLAATAGVQHAIVAIDNDGGARRRPPHAADHDVAAQAADAENGCAACLLLAALAGTWTATPDRKSIVVPVQTLETWLLVLRGFAFSEPTPEQCYDRAKLKRCCFGRPTPPEAERTRLALLELGRPGALETLRQRPSFRAFEEQLLRWR